MTCLVIIAFALINGLIGYFSGPSIALDDIKINVLTQSWQWGYLTSNPPLFEWMLKAVQIITGPTIVSFLIVKYALFCMSAGLTWSCFMRISNDSLLSGAGTLGLIGLYQIGYNYHQVFTHSLVLIAMVAALCWITARLLDTRSWYNFILLGIILGFGLLAKYSFAAAMLVIGIALATSARGRAVIFSPRIVVSVCIAGLFIAPHGYWQFSQAAVLAEELDNRLSTDGMWLMRVAHGVPSAIYAIIAFFMPLGLAGLLRARILVAQIKNGPAIWTSMPGIGAVLIVLTVLMLGMSSVQERYAIAFLLPGYFAVFTGLYGALSGTTHRTIFMALIVATIVLVPVIRTAQIFVPGAPFCSGCRQWIPFEQLAEELSDHTKGISQHSLTITAFDDHTAGNMRRYFPRARILSTRLRTYVPPVKKPIETCLFVWSADIAGAPPTELIERFDQSTMSHVDGAWTHPLRKIGWRKTRWTIAPLPKAHELYSVLCGTQ